MEMWVRVVVVGRLAHSSQMARGEGPKAAPCQPQYQESSLVRSNHAFAENCQKGPTLKAKTYQQLFRQQEPKTLFNHNEVSKLNILSYIGIIHRNFLLLERSLAVQQLLF